MDTLFTWGGRCFGYRDGDDLWTHEGKHIGKFYGDEVFGPDGSYLGELRNAKLITNTSRKSRRRSGFTLRLNRIGRINSIDHIGSVMIVGYEEFPKLEE